MTDHPLTLMVRKLDGRVPLSESAKAAIMNLPCAAKVYEAPAYLIREGATGINHCGLVLSGYAYRQKLTVDGARQIVSLHMRGDLLDLQHLFLGRADHSVQALTRLEVLNIDRAPLQALILAEPTIAKAMWIEALIDASIYREWVLNVGRRDAKTRIAHLLCEFAVRSKVAGLSDGRTCQLPMTQEQLGDAVGLTSVHVNRTLKALVEDGVIQRNNREIAITDWTTVRRAGDFSALYLHLNENEALPA